MSLPIEILTIILSNLDARSLTTTAQVSSKFCEISSHFAVKAFAQALVDHPLVIGAKCRQYVKIAHSAGEFVGIFDLYPNRVSEHPVVRLRCVFASGGVYNIEDYDYANGANFDAIILQLVGRHKNTQAARIVAKFNEIWDLEQTCYIWGIPRMYVHDAVMEASINIHNQLLPYKCDYVGMAASIINKSRDGSLEEIIDRIMRFSAASPTAQWQCADAVYPFRRVIELPWDIIGDIFTITNDIGLLKTAALINKRLCALAGPLIEKYVINNLLTNPCLDLNSNILFAAFEYRNAAIYAEVNAVCDRRSYCEMVAVHIDNPDGWRSLYPDRFRIFCAAEPYQLAGIQETCIDLIMSYINWGGQPHIVGVYPSLNGLLISAYERFNAHYAKLVAASVYWLISDNLLGLYSYHKSSCAELGYHLQPADDIEEVVHDLIENADF